MIRFNAWLVLVACGLYLFSPNLVAAKEPVRPVEFVDLTLLLTNANYDMRYFSENNFVGERIDGYKAPKCLVHIAVANALIRASERIKHYGLQFKFYDCYRPQKAVHHFMRWAIDLTDTKTKQEYYPNIDKNKLVGEYIAQRSGHTRGYTIDVTLEQMSMSGEYIELDMGTPYDLFDTRSNTQDLNVTLEQKKNRYLLLGLMQEFGFINYPKEWWHFTLESDPNDKYWDFDIE